jgi:uncharacterized membrane protein YfcA
MADSGGEDSQLDWPTGIALGIGGLAGAYTGAHGEPPWPG